MDAQTFQQFIVGTGLGASSGIQDVCVFTCTIRKEYPKLSEEAKCASEPLQRGIQQGFGSAIDVYLGFVVNPWPQGLWQPRQDVTFGWFVGDFLLSTLMDASETMGLLSHMPWSMCFL